jgi:hypothetical protein
VILAHHGFGEEVIVSALAGSGGASVAVLLWRARISRALRWLRRP